MKHHGITLPLHVVPAHSVIGVIFIYTQRNVFIPHLAYRLVRDYSVTIFRKSTVKIHSQIFGMIFWCRGDIARRLMEPRFFRREIRVTLLEKTEVISVALQKLWAVLYLPCICHCVRHANRFKNILPDIILIGHAAHRLNYFSKQIVIHICILILSIRIRNLYIMKFGMSVKAACLIQE